MAALPQVRGPFTDPSVHSSRSAFFHRRIVDSVAACFSCGGSSARLAEFVVHPPALEDGAGKCRLYRLKGFNAFARR